jgi:hypothetical protein
VRHILAPTPFLCDETYDCGRVAGPLGWMVIRRCR